MAKLVRHISRRQVISVFLVLFLLVLGIVALGERRPPTFQSLPPPYEFPVSLRERLERWIPSGWGWAWRVEEALIGRRKPLKLYAQVVTIADWPSVSSGAGLGRAGFSEQRLSAWLLSGKEYAQFCDHLARTERKEVTWQPRVVTAEGIESRLGVGAMVPLDGSTNFVGLQFAVVGRLHADRKDLSFCLRVTELVTNQVVELQTNFNAGLRVQVPTGNRLLVVEQRPQSSRKVMAFLLEPPPL